jgi:hypothetical protein
MIRWTGLAPWEFEFLFSGRLAPTFLVLFFFYVTLILGMRYSKVREPEDELASVQ